MEKPKKGINRKWLWGIGLFAVVLLVILLLKSCGTKKIPVAAVSDVRASGPEDVVSADVSLCNAYGGNYPAASFRIAFDKARLELQAVNEGNTLIHSEQGEILPQWNVNVDAANETGEINIMYLDLTGGTRAFSFNGKSENEILFRLQFRVRGSVRAGEVCSLDILDGVMAANDEKNSLASTAGTLRLKNGSIVIEAD